MTKWQFPTEVDNASWAVRSFIHRNVYKIQTSFVGLERLKGEDLEVLLPTDKPFWWWLISAPSIERGLVANPIVKSAAIERCEWYALRCFKINIVERYATALFSLPGGWWLLGDDGVMIGQITADGKARSELPTIEGGARFSATPGVMRERILSVLALLSVFNDRDIKSITFSSDTEIILSFTDRSYEVLFELGTPDRVKEQIARLAEVKSQLGERIKDVSRIDLAFNSQAVVRFKEPALLPAQNRPKRPK